VELVDTNVLSELIRPRADPGVLRWAERTTDLALSVVTVEEVWFGLAWRPSRRIEDWFTEFLGEACRVLPVTSEIAEVAGRLRGQLKAGGETRTQADMLIAATAQHHGLVLVTRNTRDFDGCGIALFDPFSGPGGRRSRR
jgi:predicted nucleic acid-binding protein